MMIVRSLEEVKGTKGHVKAENWSTLRLLLQEDGMGFTVSETICEPGMDNIIQYKDYLEACYCIEGRGSVQDIKTGAKRELAPGTLYCFNEHVPHRLRADSRMRLVCVFSPALAGAETHNISPATDK